MPIVLRKIAAVVGFKVVEPLSDPTQDALGMVQAALNSGSWVYIAGGTYAFSAPLVINSGQRVWVSRDAKIIPLANGTNDLLDFETNSPVDAIWWGGELDGTTQGAAGAQLVRFGNASKCWLIHAYVHDARKVGVNIKSTCQQIGILFSRIENCGQRQGTAGNTRGLQDNGFRTFVVGNIIEGNGYKRSYGDSQPSNTQGVKWSSGTNSMYLLNRIRLNGGKGIEIFGARNDTTVNGAQNLAALPSNRLTVASTSGFASQGELWVISDQGRQNLAYTSIVDGTHFGGVNGGTGTAADGAAVKQNVSNMNVSADGVFALNLLELNEEIGIFLNGCRGMVVALNLVRNNRNNGIDANSAQECAIVANRLAYNGSSRNGSGQNQEGSGLFLNGVTDFVVVANLCRSNSQGQHTDAPAFGGDGRSGIRISDTTASFGLLVALNRCWDPRTSGRGDTTLAAPLAASDQTMQLTDSSQLPTDGPFTVLIDFGGANPEIVIVLSCQGSGANEVVPIWRAENNSNGVAHNAGVAVSLRQTQKFGIDQKGNDALGSDNYTIAFNDLRGNLQAASHEARVLAATRRWLFNTGYATDVHSYLSADVSNSTNVAAGTGLKFTIGANEVWKVTFDLILTTTAGGHVFSLSGPAGAINVAMGVYDNNSAVSNMRTSTTGAFNGNTATLGAYAGTAVARVFAVIENGATAGTVELQFADVANGETIVVKRGSSMDAMRIA